METNGVDGLHLTPAQAHAALADTEHVRASAAKRSATPWPTWFFVTLTLYIAAFPFVYGGLVADRDWLIPRPAWLAVALTLTALYAALFAVAARSWRARTGVALRLDVLPRRVTVPASIGLPVLLVGSPLAFRLTGSPGWLAAASGVGAAVSVAFHLAFVRLHRKPA
ncbi:hypothetical protein GTW43_11845 [Streptomyces sp. SID5785]|uniref:hypothetical protein n=1 Tax=Streptomyces sp. SID5785 TaxID=2690309 RepID=UPI001361837B|nr:hypothetical protein [Streptomyces sp. SID5785]MZD05774.1 hypothetical protein [Streptomyces sp. SID5785]